MFIITNNPKVRETLRNIEIDFRDLGYLEILEYIRDLIHNNYRLITHPLYGSVKPYETIYRTVVLEEGNVLDFNSLSLIEDAITTAKKFLKFFDNSKYTEDVLEDLQVVDLDIIENALGMLN